MSQKEGDAKERLLTLMEVVFWEESAKYDLAVRAWAVREPEARKIVQRVDRFRLSYVRSLLAEMGFRGKELEIRTEVFVIFHSLEHSITVRGTKEERSRLLKQRHAMIT